MPSESRKEAQLAAHVASVLREGGADGRGSRRRLRARLPARDAPVGAARRPSRHGARAGQHPGPDRPRARPRPRRVSDMLGALAVMIELVLARAPYAALFFPREELPSTESALTPLLERSPVDADFVVVMEPTDSELHAGCLGNINATWTFHGRSGHSARPWQADNAIHKRRGRDRRAGLRPVAAGDLPGADVPRGGVGHQGRGRDRDERDPGDVRGAGQLPLRARAGRRARPRSGCASHAGARRAASSGNSPSAPVAVDHPLARS